MTNLSTDAANKINDHISGQAAYTPPAGLYLCLLKSASAASDDTTTNAAKEVETPTVNGYTRQAVSLGASSGGVATNTGAVTFGPSTTGWSEATHYWITDAATGGNIIYQGALSSAVTVAASGSVTIDVGALTVTTA